MHGRVGSMAAWQGSRPERLEGLVALEGLGERHATLGAELVFGEAAHTAKRKGEKEQVRAMGAKGMGGLG